MRDLFFNAAFIVLALALLLIFFMSLASDTLPKELQAIEVHEYEGQNLDSISAFRENSINGVQHVDIDGYRLQLKGLVDNPINYTYYAVTSNYPPYTKVVTLNCVEGWSATVLWEGVLLKDMLNDAQPWLSANTVIFKAYDGYTTSLPLDYILDNDILLAYKINNVTLPPERGFPFHLVAESKWGYKWIKWVTEIELSDDPDYLGTWERAGYSASGDIDKSFLER